MSGRHLKTVIRAEFTIGEWVYFAAARERAPGIVSGIIFRMNVAIYLVSWGPGNETGHYDFELTQEFTPDFGTPDE